MHRGRSDLRHIFPSGKVKKASTLNPDCKCFFYLRLGFPKEGLFDCVSQRGGAKRSIVLISFTLLTLLQLAHVRKVANMI